MNAVDPFDLFDRGGRLRRGTAEASLREWGRAGRRATSYGANRDRTGDLMLAQRLS